MAEKCDVVAAYIMDVYQPGIDKLATPAMRKITDKLDHLFVSYEQSIPKIQEVSQCAGLAAAAGGGCAHARRAQRRSADRYHQLRPAISETHKKLQQAFNYPQSPRIYYHSTFKFLDYPQAEDYREHRQMFFQMLRRAKIAINYRYSQTTAWNSRGIDPLTSAMVRSRGRRGNRRYKPQGPEAAREFDWPDAVINFPEPNDDPVGFITSLLNDPERLRRRVGVTSSKPLDVTTGGIAFEISSIR